MHTLEPLRDEHRTLLPHIERLRELADRIGDLAPEEVATGVADAHDFLTGHLMPHAEAEEEVLYPAVGRVLGTAAATATMSRDHAEVARLTDELGRLRDRPGYPEDEQRTLRRVLYGLYALVGVHFAKEEEVYLPLLEESLGPEEAERILAEMARAAHAGT
jgi:iron-sulfur cluster repair protein YtfE (RIC family)